MRKIYAYLKHEVLYGTPSFKEELPYMIAGGTGALYVLTMYEILSH